METVPVVDVPIVVIDDDSEMLRVIARHLTRRGLEISTFTNPKAAVASFEERRYGVVITDVQMEELSGQEVLEEAKRLLPSAVVIMITGFGSVQSAVQAMKKGAFDYISKPFDIEEFLVVVEKALEQYDLRREIQYLRKTVEERYSFGNIIGKSPAMQRVFEVIVRITDTRTNVLIEGQSGTGKELIARAIHFTGLRKEKPFVAINCAAIPESLLESELFGHERGAYTGAVTREPGLFVSANEGTIFLDEIADMPQAMQTKLLRVLEDWEIRPVGGNASRKVNVRVIAASKERLSEAVQAGRFREDLFYRLNVVNIVLPVLRERKEDIPLLVDFVLDKLHRDRGGQRVGVSRNALAALIDYNWPGNVRELEHTLERALIFTKSGEVAVNDLPAHIVSGGHDPLRGGKDGAQSSTLQELEKEHIIKVLAHVHWRRAQAADLLGINRRTLYRKIREYGIEKEKTG